MCLVFVYDEHAPTEKCFVSQITSNSLKVWLGTRIAVYQKWVWFAR